MKIIITVNLTMVFMFNPANIFYIKMMSAYYVCCIYSNTLQKTFTMAANGMNPDQLLLREQSDLCPYLLQY